MATFSKEFLSNSTNGSPIKVVATSSTGTLIHSTGGSNKIDEVWLYAYNSHTSAVVLTLQLGGTTSPDNDIKITVTPQSGLILIVPGLILKPVNDVPAIIYAYAATANVITISGYVNRIL